MPLPEALERAYDSALSALASLQAEIDKLSKEKDLEFTAWAELSISRSVKEVNGSLDFANKILDPVQDPPRGRPRRQSSETRAFIFPKQEWTPVTARAWLRDHSKKFGKMDVVGSSFHFPQTETEGPILGTIVVQNTPKILATLVPRTP